MSEKGTVPSIMLVDDNRIDNILNRKVLEKEKIAETILIFDQAKKALEHLKAAQTDGHAIPSLIFIDIVMPEMNGFQFIHEFAKLPASLKQQTKLVFISSSVLSKAQQAELDQYDVSVVVVGKPLTKSILDQIRSV